MFLVWKNLFAWAYWFLARCVFWLTIFVLLCLFFQLLLFLLGVFEVSYLLKVDDEFSSDCCRNFIHVRVVIARMDPVFVQKLLSGEVCEVEDLVIFFGIDVLLENVAVVEKTENGWRGDVNFRFCIIFVCQIFSTLLEV